MEKVSTEMRIVKRRQRSATPLKVFHRWEEVVVRPNVEWSAVSWRRASWRREYFDERGVISYEIERQSQPLGLLSETVPGLNISI